MPDLTTYPSPTSAELRARLEARSQSINHRVAVLKQELTSARELTVTGLPVPDFIARRPLRSVGIGLAGGVALGLLTGLAKRVRNRPERGEEHLEVLRLYSASLIEDAARLVSKGKTADEAIEKTLRSRPPIVYHAPPEPSKRSTLSETFDMTVKTALGFGVKTGLDMLAKRFTHQEELFSAVKEVKDNPTI